MTVITGFCLAVSISTLLIAASLLVRKGLRAASFYGSVLGMVVPCVAVDVSLFTVDSEEQMVRTNARPPTLASGEL
ncbi:hypothetical protein AMAG_06733 [Allomyces macrogynus ATCC 38327]|uniref:Uncharacterized protein n=1 Tax=Allomyces macrogynus (strain ATCC 38327) TaxID=578462 RepID=A0A0L0SEW8_ALLM3|nr:hypothetical protein AMAG_06733 [Allomyces macrogynus ATCC 38327]|eukprot:KNE60972.1 hypothetical protein AMAG_06733 [Allomyces macrogynus ATCC 38327]